MQLVFVHGWSVTHTDTYGELPSALAAAAATVGLDLRIQHLYLGRYISFHDEVTLDDIARAMDAALRALPGNASGIQPFSCITHSTGGPVVRTWLERFYGPRKLDTTPLEHLVMLAPANHGSALAALGKARVGRIKAWAAGVEPGQRVLDWLCLGSDGQWELNEAALQYRYADAGVFPFVLTGQGIDESFYDFLNSYLVEKGSDGVVRVCGANLNYQYLQLAQDAETLALKPVGSVRKPAQTALRVYGEYSHSGKRMGIMRSIKAAAVDAPVVQDILRCLLVKTQEGYAVASAALAEATAQAQAGGSLFCMLVFNVRDNTGRQLCKDEYDLLLLGGAEFAPEALPKGFFKDRQLNEKTGRLVYYMDQQKMDEIKDSRFGIRVVARPASGFSYYEPAEFRSERIKPSAVFQRNATTYIDIVLQRFVDEEVFRFDPAARGPRSFKATKPSGRKVPPTAGQ